jgi:hypothetical protein
MKKAAFLISIVFGSLSFLAAPALAQNQGPFAFTQFSATTSMVVKGQTVTSKIARSGNKMRMEMPGSNGKRYTVYLIDQHKAYMVMGPNMCMETPPMGNIASNPLATSPQGSVDVKQLGTATVNGHPTKIEQVTVTPSGGQPTTMKVWAATDLQGFPVRTEISTPRGLVTTDYTDVSLSAPPDSLFAVPDNCRQMPTMPGGRQP